jgi:hypothetical protein
MHPATPAQPRSGALVRASLTMLLALAGTLLASCINRVSVDGDWVERVPAKQEFTNLLVVGVTPDYNTRCRFEYALADALRSATVTATASCTKMKKSDELSREGVTPVVKALGADAVIATRLVNQKARLDKGTGDDTRADYYYKAVGYGINDDYFGYFGLPVTYVDFVNTPPVLTIESTVVIATNVYRSSDAALLYTMVSKARNVQSAGDFINAVSIAIPDQLRREGLVR